MKASAIEAKIENGFTLYIQTALKITKITPATLAKWKGTGNTLFKDAPDSEFSRNFYIASGKRFDYVTSGGCSFRFVKA